MEVGTFLGPVIAPSRLHNGAGIRGMVRSFRNWLAAAASALMVLVLCWNIALAQTGNASWYSLTSLTASGERCDPTLFTAAHRSLPFGTMVQVKNLTNGRTLIVRINDRGPFVRGRIIDLTRAAAQKLGFVEDGITRVHLTVIE